jgi:hypothetical protein
MGIGKRSIDDVDIGLLSSNLQLGKRLHRVKRLQLLANLFLQKAKGPAARNGLTFFHIT